MKVLNENAIVVGFEEIEWDKFPNLKVVGCNATSTEHIDEECAKRGVNLISLKDYPEFLKTIFSTAEHTIGLIIALLRNYKTAFNPPYRDREYYIGQVLRDKTLGIIGLGRVGKQVKTTAEALGMQVVWLNGKGMPYFIFEQADCVSLHVPLQGNEGFFTKEMFRLMKPTAYFINTSRSGVVDKGALLWALENDIIAGAAVDFIDDPKLLEYAKTHDNLILTNHLGGCTVEDMQRTKEFITSKVLEYLSENKT